MAPRSGTNSLSLSFADDLRLGLISWCLKPQGGARGPSDSLRQNIDAEEPPTHDEIGGIYTAPWALSLTGSTRSLSLAPFDVVTREALAGC
jgi:hypothetical protein